MDTAYAFKRIIITLMVIFCYGASDESISIILETPMRGGNEADAYYENAEKEPSFQTELNSKNNSNPNIRNKFDNFKVDKEEISFVPLPYKLDSKIMVDNSENLSNKIFSMKITNGIRKFSVVDDIPVSPSLLSLSKNVLPQFTPSTKDNSTLSHSQSPTDLKSSNYETRPDTNKFAEDVNDNVPESYNHGLSHTPDDISKSHHSTNASEYLLMLNQLKQPTTVPATVLDKPTTITTEPISSVNIISVTSEESQNYLTSKLQSQRPAAKEAISEEHLDTQSIPAPVDKDLKVLSLTSDDNFPESTLNPPFDEISAANHLEPDQTMNKRIMLNFSSSFYDYQNDTSRMDANSLIASGAIGNKSTASTTMTTVDNEESVIAKNELTEKISKVEIDISTPSPTKRTFATTVIQENADNASITLSSEIQMLIPKVYSTELPIPFSPDFSSTQDSDNSQFLKLIHEANFINLSITSNPLSSSTPDFDNSGVQMLIPNDLLTSLPMISDSLSSSAQESDNSGNKLPIPKVQYNEYTTVPDQDSSTVQQSDNSENKITFLKVQLTDLPIATNPVSSSTPDFNNSLVQMLIPNVPLTNLHIKSDTVFSSAQESDNSGNKLPIPKVQYNEYTTVPDQDSSTVQQSDNFENKITFLKAQLIDLPIATNPVSSSTPDSNHSLVQMLIPNVPFTNLHIKSDTASSSAQESDNFENQMLVPKVQSTESLLTPDPVFSSTQESDNTENKMLISKVQFNEYTIVPDQDYSTAQQSDNFENKITFLKVQLTYLPIATNPVSTSTPDSDNSLVQMLIPNVLLTNLNINSESVSSSVQESDNSENQMLIPKVQLTELPLTSDPVSNSTQESYNSENNLTIPKIQLAAFSITPEQVSSNNHESDNSENQISIPKVQLTELSITPDPISSSKQENKMPIPKVQLTELPITLDPVSSSNQESDNPEDKILIPKIKLTEWPITPDIFSYNSTQEPDNYKKINTINQSKITSATTTHLITSDTITTVVPDSSTYFSQQFPVPFVKELTSSIPENVDNNLKSSPSNESQKMQITVPENHVNLYDVTSETLLVRPTPILKSKVLLGSHKNDTIQPTTIFNSFNNINSVAPQLNNHNQAINSLELFSTNQESKMEQLLEENKYPPISALEAPKLYSSNYMSNYLVTGPNPSKLFKDNIIGSVFYNKIVTNPPVTLNYPVQSTKIWNSKLTPVNLFTKNKYREIATKSKVVDSWRGNDAVADEQILKPPRNSLQGNFISTSTQSVNSSIQLIQKDLATFNKISPSLHSTNVLSNETLVNILPDTPPVKHSIISNDIVPQFPILKFSNHLSNKIEMTRPQLLNNSQISKENVINKISNNEEPTLLNQLVMPPRTDRLRKGWKNYRQPQLYKNRDLEVIGSRILTIAKEFCDGRYISKFVHLLTDNGSFSDLDYENDSQAVRVHGRRIGSIAINELENEGTLSTRTMVSYEYLAYNLPQLSVTNWWWHVIGVPSSVWQAIYIAHRHLHPVLVDYLMNRYFRNTCFGSVWDPVSKSEKMAGGNFAPRAVMALVEGYIRGSFEEFYTQVRNSFYREVVDKEPYGGNGFRHDGCLHQHNLMFQSRTDQGGMARQTLSHIYNNNYGKEFLKNAALMIWFVDGTSFDFGNEIEDAVFNSFFDCEKWLYRFTTVEPTTTGRFIDSGKIVTRIGGLDAIERTLKVFEKIGRRSGEVKAALHRYNNARPSKEFALEGNKHFFSSDLMAHQRRNFMASVRLLSKRSSRPESKPNGLLQGENSKGYYQGDGFLTVLVSGKEYGSYNKEVFQVYDWARIPGTTCLYTRAVPQIPTAPYFVKHAYNDADFVGGVSNGLLGIASMVYSRPTVALRAKKSWFFFDDMVVCLGSNIYLPLEYVTGIQVSTILTQVEYDGSYIIGNSSWSKVFGDVVENTTAAWNTFNSSQTKWIFHSSTGYVLLGENGDVNVQVARKYINKSPISIFSSWLDHTPSPTDSAYSYAILPAWSPTEVAQFALNPFVIILNKTKDNHVVCYSSKVVGGVLFEEGCILLQPCLNGLIEKVCIDEPGMLLLKLIDATSNYKELCRRGIYPPFKEALLKEPIQSETHNEKYDILGPERDANSSANYNYVVRSNTHLTKSNLLSKPDRNFNEVLNGYESYPNEETKPQNVIQVSVADPTQTLVALKLSLKTSLLEKVYKIYLPKAPRLGESVNLCLQVN